MQGVWVRSLVAALSSYMWSAAKKKKKGGSLDASPNWPRDPIKPDAVVQHGPYPALCFSSLPPPSSSSRLPSLSPPPPLSPRQPIQLLTSQHMGLGEKESQPHMWGIKCWAVTILPASEREVLCSFWHLQILCEKVTLFLESFINAEDWPRKCHVFLPRYLLKKVWLSIWNSIRSSTWTRLGNLQGTSGFWVLWSSGAEWAPLPTPSLSEGKEGWTEATYPHTLSSKLLSISRESELEGILIWVYSSAPSSYRCGDWGPERRRRHL